MACITALTLITRAALGTLADDRGFVLAADEAERVCGMIPGSRVVEIPGTNHYTVGLAEVFNQAVLSFIESV